MKYHSNFICLDCNRCTLHMNEYYMVNEAIWKQALKQKERKKMLCIGCLEIRLNRRLNKKDFSKAPINKDPFQSKRLKRRLI